MQAAVFDAIRPIFGGKLSQPQVEGIENIVNSFAKYGDGNQRHLAYLLATAKHETANTMQPIHERGAKSYFNKYEPGTKIGKALGNVSPGDGYKFRGRGYVQLTGRANYIKVSKVLGLDMVKDPDLALRPDVSALVLITGCLEGWFTGKKLSDYDTFISMRRVVNGTDKAALIATYADSFYAALPRSKSVEYTPAPPPYAPIPIEDADPITTDAPTRNIMPWVIAAIGFVAIALYVLTQVRFF